MPISPVERRLPSTALGLELGFKPDGKLGLYNPQTGNWQLLRKERAEEAEARADQAEVRADQAEAKAQQEAEARRREVEVRLQAEAEAARLRAEIERLQVQQK